MRKRLGSRIAFISALAMLATEVLSPVAVIAAEDVVAESEYVEAFSQEDAYEEAADDAEVEDVQADDSESVEINGEEDAVEEDVVGAAVSGSIDLNGHIYNGPDEVESIDGVLTMETKTATKGEERLDYRVFNIKGDGEFYVYNGGSGPLENTYINVEGNANAKLSFGNFEVNNEGLAWILGKGKTDPDDNTTEGVSFIEAQAGSKITLDPCNDPNVRESEITVAGGGFINQKGTASVIDVNLANDTKDSNINVDIVDGVNNKYNLITTEGTMNMNSGELWLWNAPVGVNVKGGTLNVKGGELQIWYCDTSADIHNGTLNVTDGEFYTNGPLYDGIRGEAGTVNVKGGKVNMTEVEGNGINADNVDISGGKVDIDIVHGGNDMQYYTSGTDNIERNTLTVKDGVYTARINQNTGSHKGIKTGEKEKTIKFKNDKTADVTVPASGSLKISGGQVRLSTIGSGTKFNKIGATGSAEQTDAGIYIIGDPDDTIYSGKDVEISGGEVYLFSADRGITAGETVAITKEAKVQIPNCYEGIEGKLIKIGEKDDTTVSPNVLIGAFDQEKDPDVKPLRETYCLDDGICASSATITETYESPEEYNGNRGAKYTLEITPSDGGNLLKTYSGNVDIYIDSEGVNGDYICYFGGGQVNFYPCGDGIDCNGTYDDRGGFVRVYGDADDNIPFKTNNDFIFTNGPWMLGTGTDKDGKSLPTAGAGVYLVWGGKTGDVPTGGYEDDVLGDGEFSFKAKDKFVVKDSKDQVIYENELPFGGTFIIFGSPDLKAGEKYKVTVGDKEPKEITGLRKNETDPVDTDDNPEDPDSADKDKDPSISVNKVLGYTVSYNSSISYNGAKIYLPYFVFDGAKVGGTISNNTIIFKKIKYKNNKFVGQAQMRLQFKAAKTKKDGSKFSKEEKAKIKAEVKKLNDYFKKNYLTFEIVPRQLLANEIVEVKGTYKAKKSKFSIKLRVDTKATNAKGKALKPIKVKEVKKSGKGDFEIDPKSFNEKNGTVVLKGKNNFTGTCTVKGIVAK